MKHRAVVDVVLLGDVRRRAVDQRGEQRRSSSRAEWMISHGPLAHGPIAVAKRSSAHDRPRALAGERRAKPVDEEILRSLDTSVGRSLELELRDELARARDVGEDVGHERILMMAPIDAQPAHRASSCQPELREYLRRVLSNARARRPSRLDTGDVGRRAAARRSSPGAGADGPPTVARRELRMRHERVDVVHATIRDARAIEPVDDIGRGASDANDASMTSRELGAVRGSSRVPSEALVGRRAPAARAPRAEQRPFALVLNAEENVASVAGADADRRRDRRMRGAAARRRPCRRNGRSRAVGSSTRRRLSSIVTSTRVPCPV